MTSYSDEVRVRFEALEDEHLIDKVRGGQLTEQAHAIALSLLAARGVDTSGLPEQPPQDGPGETWLQPTEGDQREHAQRRRMIFVALTYFALPFWCLGVVAAAASVIGHPGPWDGVGALALTLIGCGLGMRQTWRYATQWGDLPMKPGYLDRISRTGVFITALAIGITVIGAFVAIAAMFR